MALAALLLSLSGCTVNHVLKLTEFGSEELVQIREVPDSPLSDTLKLFSDKGPQPTERTVQLLQKHELYEDYEEKPRETLQGLARANMASPSAEKVYAISELAFVLGKKAERQKDEDLALDMYGSSVANAYYYLFDRGLDPTRNPYDPQFRLARDLYNGALESSLRIVNARGQLVPGRHHRIEAGDHQFDVAVTTTGKWRADDFKRFEFVSDYEVTGLRNRYGTHGLGVPLIAVCKRNAEDCESEYYPDGLAVPVTAFLRVIPDQKVGERVHCCELELHDPLESSEIIVEGRATPLHSDLSTPLAYFLNQPVLRNNFIGTFGLLDADAGQQFKGIYMMEPYDPDKIPVLMVHGLWSSPVTWMEMFNDLRGDPEIRGKYQFWFFLYPTGQPFWISATQLRSELAELRKQIDPQRRIATLDEMVVIGHSMGGLVSMLQTIESSDDFLRIISDRPFEELKADEETRQGLANTLFFHPNPSIKHVITMGTPHRGSHFANKYTRKLGRSLITLPKFLVQSSQQLVKDNPDFFRNTKLLTTTTSIDSLAPTSPILPVMLAARKSPWTRYHNVVGRVSDDTFAARLSPNSDGVVPVASAERDDFHTQSIVEASHSHVHSHPRAILHVRRVLVEHLASRRRKGPASQPGFAARPLASPARPASWTPSAEPRRQPQPALPSMLPARGEMLFAPAPPPRLQQPVSAGRGAADAPATYSLSG